MTNSKPKFLIKGYSEMSARYEEMTGQLHALRDRMRQLRMTIRSLETEKRNTELRLFFKQAMTEATKNGSNEPQSRINAIGKSATKFQISKAHVRRIVKEPKKSGKKLRDDIYEFLK